jgi:hypothetical protein
MANPDQNDYHFSLQYHVHGMEQINQNGVIPTACIQTGGLINHEYLRIFLFTVTDIQHKNIILYFHRNLKSFSFHNSTDNSLIVKACMKCFFSLMTNVKKIYKAGLTTK